MNKQKLIEQLLEQALREGRWKLFEHLPPERNLAEEFGVNRNTLRGAISALIGRGLLEREDGHSSRIIAMPDDGLNDLGENILACRILVPPAMHAVSLAAKPSRILNLERIFPVAGAALRNDNIKEFARAQLQFFRESAAILENRGINMAIQACLPQIRPMTVLLSNRGLQENEMLFAHLARILGFIRHMKAVEASEATEAYFSFLSTLMEKK